MFGRGWVIVCCCYGSTRVVHYYLTLPQAPQTHTLAREYALLQTHSFLAQTHTHMHQSSAGSSGNAAAAPLKQLENLKHIAHVIQIIRTHHTYINVIAYCSIARYSTKYITQHTYIMQYNILRVTTYVLYNSLYFTSVYIVTHSIRVLLTFYCVAYTIKYHLQHTYAYTSRLSNKLQWKK